MVRRVGAECTPSGTRVRSPSPTRGITQAFDTFGEILHGEGFVLGGPRTCRRSTSRTHRAACSRTSGLRYAEAGLVHSQLVRRHAGYEDGEEAEIAVFAFPTIDGNTGAMGGGDTLLVFDGAEANVRR